jgi:hypothetical protein
VLSLVAITEDTTISQRFSLLTTADAGLRHIASEIHVRNGDEIVAFHMES